MNSVVSKIIIALLSVFAIIYFSYQVYQFIYDPYETQIANTYNYTNQVELNGVVIKDETIINQSFDGVVKYQYENAQKVTSGSKIAELYATENDLIGNQKIAKLNNRIALLNNIKNSGQSSLNLSAQAIISNTSKYQSDVLKAVKYNDFNDLEDISDKFLDALLKQQIILNDSLELDSTINALNSRAAEISAQINGVSVEVTAPSSGYFTNKIDGYEGVITSDILNNLSLESVQSLINDTKPVDDNSDCIGKLITKTQWYFVALVESKNISYFKQGNRIELSFANDTKNKVSTDIFKVVPYLDNKYSVVVLESEILNENIINYRKETPFAVLSTGEGLKVDRSAVRIVNGELGVYVNMGQVIKFKKLDIVYEAEDYVISRIVSDTFNTNADEAEEQINADDYLQLYDEIIVKGEDLYDNKPI